MIWESPQETHAYEPLYLANGTFGGLLDLSGTDLNLWSSQIVGAPRISPDNHGVHYPVTALRTQVYYKNPYFRDRGFHISRSAILTNDPIYTTNPSMPHKASIYECHQSLNLDAGLARTSGTVYPGSRSSLLAEEAAERAIPFETEVVFLKDSPLMSMCIRATNTDTEITFDPVPVLEDRLVIDNSGDSVYSLGNELQTDIRVSQKILHQETGASWIQYVIRPEGDAPYTIRIRSENGRVSVLNGRPVLVAESRLAIQVEILPQTDERGDWEPEFTTHDAVVSEQSARWRSFWATSGVELPESEFLWQERYRASLFYIAQSVCDGPTHPVGLSKPMLPYWFGSFHDTDTYFCRPLLEAGHFQLAALNLKFRHRTLDTACEQARTKGMTGALFPWQVDPHGRGESRFVPMCQAIIACEAWHQYLYRGDEVSREQASAIVTGIFENLLECVDTGTSPWSLKETTISTFSETIDAEFPDEAVLALCATAEAYLALCGRETEWSSRALRVLDDFSMELDHAGAYRIVRDGDPEYLRCPSMTLGAWPLRHLPADKTMRKSLHKELARIVSVFAWMPHQLSALASRLGESEGPVSGYAILKEADNFYKTWHAFDEWENRRTMRAKIFVTAAGGFCTAIHHLLLAEGEPGSIRLFPGIPSHWRSCSFEELRTPLGWSVSAELRDGVIISLSARPTHSQASPVTLQLSHPISDVSLPESWSIRLSDC